MRDDKPWFDLAALQELEGEAPLDEIFEVLSDQLSRFALYYLAETDAATLDEVAEAVTGFEAQASERIATPADKEDARIQLYHRVLPKLDARGFVEFDVDELTVTLAEPPEELLAPDGIGG